ncbi:MAG: hypothetical protein PHW84_02025 [Methanosarcina sp.]|nr:hypothetical protein [Methanosarcina sp.]
MSKKSFKVIDGVAVAAGATGNPIPIKIEESINQAIVYIKNTGASTSLTVNIYSSYDGIEEGVLLPVTLDTTLESIPIIIDVVPEYLIFKPTNNDTQHATTFDVNITKIA